MEFTVYVPFHKAVYFLCKIIAHNRPPLNIRDLLVSAKRCNVKDLGKKGLSIKQCSGFSCNPVEKSCGLYYASTQEEWGDGMGAERMDVDEITEVLRRNKDG